MKEIIVPELAESISEGTIAEWLVKEGESVQKGDPICELETDKVNVEVNAEYSGTLAKIVKQEGEDVEVGEVIAEIDENGSSASSSDSVESKEEAPKEESKKEDVKVDGSKESASTSTSSKDKVVASPATRKRARELGIDLAEVQASDPLGRVRTEDVEKHSNGSSKQEATQTKMSSQTAASNESSSDDRIEREKMSRRRQTIAKRLVEAQHNSAMLTTFNEVDMSAVMKLRSERKDKFQEKHGVKLGFMSFFTKAVVAALKDFPYLNAEIEDNEILLKKFYDIGIAVSTDDGLVVPVVRDADKLDFAGIESEIMDLGLKARNKELQLKDLQGGSFTITNGGIFGSLLSTPILNAPQVGILGMHTIQKRPVAMPDDTIEIRPMMYVALSYDHRIVDGKEAVQFLVRIKQLLEDPYDLLLEG